MTRPLRRADYRAPPLLLGMHLMGLEMMSGVRTCSTPRATTVGSIVPKTPAASTPVLVAVGAWGFTSQGLGVWAFDHLGVLALGF